MTALACVICGIPIEPTGRGGSPRKFCSLRCRRLAQHRLDAVPTLRRRLAWWQEQAALHPRDPVYQFETRAAALAARIDRLTREKP